MKVLVHRAVCLLIVSIELSIVEDSIAALQARIQGREHRVGCTGLRKHPGRLTLEQGAKLEAPPSFLFAESLDRKAAASDRLEQSLGGEGREQRLAHRRSRHPKSFGQASSVTRRPGRQFSG